MDIFVVLSILGLMWGAINQFRISRYDGSIHLEEDAVGLKTFFLDLDYEPDELVHKKRIIFRVERDR